MITALDQAEAEQLEAFDLDLFCLELEYQVQTRLKADIKRVLDERDAAFQAQLAANPAVAAERARLAQEHAEYQRRKERREYVTSGAAARAAEAEALRSRPPVMEMAGQLAKQWNVPCISDTRWQAHTT
ncbi:MAG: hypothetical protein ABSE73_04765 [Planctomycetota bacterium]